MDSQVCIISNLRTITLDAVILLLADFLRMYIGYTVYLL